MNGHRSASAGSGTSGPSLQAIGDLLEAGADLGIHGVMPGIAVELAEAASVAQQVLAGVVIDAVALAPTPGAD